MTDNDRQTAKAAQFSTPHVRVEAVTDSNLFQVSVHDLGVVTEDEARAFAVAVESILKGTLGFDGNLVLRWR